MVLPRSCQSAEPLLLLIGLGAYKSDRSAISRSNAKGFCTVTKTSTCSFATITVYRVS